MSDMIYVVETFGGPGIYVPPRTVECGTLAEARTEARRRLGLRRLHRARKGGVPDEADMTAVEAWCAISASEYARSRRNLGGVAIYRKARRRCGPQ